MPNPPSATEVVSVSAADGTRLSVYRDTPVRPRPGAATVVLVHSASVTADLWRVHARHLTGLGLTVVRYDQRAHGHTPRGQAPLTIRQLADDLHHILTHLVPAGPLVLAGHFLGALVLQELAALHPQHQALIRGMVLLSATARGASVLPGRDPRAWLLAAGRSLFALTCTHAPQAVDLLRHRLPTTHPYSLAPQPDRPADRPMPCRPHQAAGRPTPCRPPGDPPPHHARPAHPPPRTHQRPHRPPRRRTEPPPSSPPGPIISELPTFRAISLGAGIQSSAMLALSAQGILPKVDYAIFADTGWEPRAVYSHLDRLEREIAGPAGIPVLRVSSGNIRKDALDPEHRFASMPLYVLNKDGKPGMTRRQCTGEYKIKPIKKKVRELLGYPYPTHIPRGVFVEQWVGISTDEFHRAKDADVKYMRNRHPLVSVARSSSQHGQDEPPWLADWPATSPRGSPTRMKHCQV